MNQYIIIDDHGNRRYAHMGIYTRRNAMILSNRLTAEGVKNEIIYQEGACNVR